MRFESVNMCSIKISKGLKTCSNEFHFQILTLDGKISIRVKWQVSEEKNPRVVKLLLQHKT